MIDNILVAVGFDKRVVVELVVDVAFDCSRIGLHLERKQFICLTATCNTCHVYHINNYINFDLNPVNCEPVNAIVECGEGERAGTNVIVCALQQVAVDFDFNVFTMIIARKHTRVQ